MEENKVPEEQEVTTPAPTSEAAQETVSEVPTNEVVGEESTDLEVAPKE